MSRCLFFGYICGYQAFDFDDFTCCCKGSSETLCLFSQHCLAHGEQPLGCGLLEADEEKKEVCKVGCNICICGIKEPSTCCAGSSQILCLYQAQALPFDEKHMAEPACAYYCLSCLPECGCCVSPPDCPALGKTKVVAAPNYTKIERSVELR